jgi:GTPase SAR1 family protein
VHMKPLVCLCSPASFSNVTSKWVPEIQRFAPEVKFILTGLQKDQRYDKQARANLERKGLECITYEQGAELASELGVPYVECSSLTREGVKDVFDVAVRTARIARDVQRPCVCAMM